MPVWHVDPVDRQPEITLVRWRVFETETGARHFVGYDLQGNEGRVSSAIRQFSPKALRGITESGRLYVLKGPPGYDDNALYVWKRWLAGYGVSRVEDVTAKYADRLPRRAGRAGKSHRKRGLSDE